ncbi:DNA topoisomerase IB [Streptomyces sp. NPDC001941]|uniref:DNA topoisomerase IB n=1 Tax=Streptomyces sp. NPDC001941 TaxID=3154659 RepID=UPI003328DD37
MRLRTSRLELPGHERLRHGRGFRYRTARGGPLSSADLERIRALAIPPAWRDVWICPWANGHVQATGVDDAGRRQYLYHPEFRRQQELAKHEHVREVSTTLPDVRDQVARDLQGRGLSRERVLGGLVRLLDHGYFRIGSPASARAHEAYGLTTLLRSHVRCVAGELRFTYPGKSGVERCWRLPDPDAFRVVRALRRRPGDDPALFAYWRTRSWHTVEAGELNEHLRELSGADLTAKDFRTWHATVLAAVGLAVAVRSADAGDAARRRAEAQVVRDVSRYLGNTPAVCRASYINPRLFELYAQGRTIAADLDALGADTTRGTPATQGPIEESVRALLA